ncbi:MAG: hypothetical protein ACRCTR_00640 [Actinomycetota bacterium]
MNQDQPAHRDLPISWIAIRPIKHPAIGKSRLVPPVGISRPTLARAIALDSLTAARTCPAVKYQIVVTNDLVISADAAQRGEMVVADPGADLAAAIAVGLSVAQSLRCNDSPLLTGIAVILADIPAVQPEDLTVALTAASRHRTAFVPDVEGAGTVLLTSRVLPLMHHFGPGSADRHQQLGAHRLDLDLPRLRQDVDTATAFGQAVALGVGPATQAVLAQYRQTMQATVHHLDVYSDGSVITDTGDVIPFTSEVLARSGLRHVRVGQRLTVTITEGPRVTALGVTGVPGTPQIQNH